uniref:Uncharacterized protein n=1 Tax=Podoviridae sp. ct5cR14 TaxID=2825220 RepID=A0A8S5PSW6_9CAUD|nr:MAG TPA: hypothetical protein [Podoviridae sp. ct5cR14]
MNKLEYIPGDLVMVKKSALQFAKDKIFKVISSLSGGFVKVVMLNDSSTTYSISNNAIRPIPITPEILEKNGWKKPDGFDSYWLDKIGLLQEGDTWHSALGSTKIAITLGNILYVHQLQHLLFGLGLNSEMEV